MLSSRMQRREALFPIRASFLQGEVEQIAMMKPKAQGPHDEGLLEYLSDIIGCDHYNEQIDQASQR
jgi:structural maintenance of chromosome 4